MVGVGQVQGHVHLRDAQRLQLRREPLAVIHHMVGAHPTTPFRRCVPRRGGHHGEAGMACQLNRDGTHAAGASDDQQGLASVASIIEMQWHALEQQFPRGQHRQRKRRCLGEIQRGRLASHKALIHPLPLRIAAGPGDIARVIHLVTGENAVTSGPTASTIPAAS